MDGMFALNKGNVIAGTTRRIVSSVLITLSQHIYDDGWVRGPCQYF